MEEVEISGPDKRAAVPHDEAFKKLLESFFKEFIELFFPRLDQLLDIEPDFLAMAIPEYDILRFQFLKVELRSKPWRTFIESDNPVAAALLAKMAYNTDLYFKPNNEEEEEAILKELSEQYPEEGEAIMDFMPAWKRWGYEEGMEEGLEKGIEKGIEKGKEEVIRKFLQKGFSPEKVAETIEVPVAEIRKLMKQ